MTTYRLLVEDWQVYDNRTEEPRLVAFGSSDGIVVRDTEFNALIERNLERK